VRDLFIVSNCNDVERRLKKLEGPPVKIKVIPNYPQFSQSGLMNYAPGYKDPGSDIRR
jgi:hypothetical protein